ncbi:MAG: hypothetical protein WA747_12905 [Steroidobacteraceae bacterium]
MSAPPESPADHAWVNSYAVARWHTLLRAIAALNAALWSLAAVAVARQHAIGSASYLQLLLSALYVAGCAFRSALPVFDIPRLVLVDSRLSSVLIGRSVATVAELCFAAQWALILHRTALLSGSSVVHAASLAVLPLIAVAEGCSWHAVLTTGQRGHVVENSIWGLAAALAVAGMLAIGPHRLAALYPPMVLWCLGGAAYVAFIFGFDVPMYWSRWRADQASGRRYLSIAGGFVEVRRRGTVSCRWQDWKNEMPWMSLYFTFGVWCSISLVYASLALGG